MTSTEEGTMTEQIQQMIRDLARECVVAANREGWVGGVAEYEYTESDCRYIEGAVKVRYGRMPTREEWAEAGMPHVGGKHCEA